MGAQRQARLPAFLILSLAWLAAQGDAARAVSLARRDVQPPTALRIRADRDHAPELPAARLATEVAAPFRRFEGDLLPLEVALFADAADGRLDDHSLLAAALIAGGVDDPQRLAFYENRVDALVRELRKSGRVSGTPRQQARAVFEFMHGRILQGGYQLNCSDLAVALDRGKFNCVSASVLFNYLAGQFDLATCGLEIPGHAMSRVLLDGDEPLDIETTCPRWFELMDDPEKQADLVARTTGFRHADRRAEQRREVSGTELVATIYYNRGVDLLAEEKYAEALAANAKSLRLDPTNETARGNLLATINNWAIALGRRGRFEEAVARLAEGIALAPDYDTFALNYAHVYHQWTDRCCRDGKFEKAIDLLADARESSPQVAYFTDGQYAVYGRWAEALFAAGDASAALDLLADARRRYGVNPAWLQAEASAINQAAVSLLDDERYEAALEILQRGLALQPGCALLENNHRAAVMRWAEPAFQSGDFAEAIRRTTRGSTPGGIHESLLGNVRYGYYQWMTRLLDAGQRERAERVRSQALADPFLAGRADSAIPPFDRK